MLKGKLVELVSIELFLLKLLALTLLIAVCLALTVTCGSADTQVDGDITVCKYDVDGCVNVTVTDLKTDASQIERPQNAVRAKIKHVSNIPYVGALI